MHYDSNSTDAIIARIDQRLSTQDATLAAILTEVRKTNGRVTALETENAVSKGKIAVISMLVSCAVGLAGWIASHTLDKP
jgi:hypothetical protein